MGAASIIKGRGKQADGAGKGGQGATPLRGGKGNAGGKESGKGGKPREVPVPRRALPLFSAYLRGWRATQPGVWLFPSPQGRGGRAISSRTVGRFCGDLGDSAGVTGFHPHRCRHTLATRMEEAGVPAGVQAAILGHDSTTTTRGYHSPGLAAARNALESL